MLWININCYSGYIYSILAYCVHIPCQQRTTTQETRKLLRHLNINTSRILDISFPGRNIIGLLVHHHYLPEIISIMQIAKIPILKDSDPTHADNLKDSKYKKRSTPDEILFPSNVIELDACTPLQLNLLP
ncbi:hypothetical protein INT45_001056 [Circinella minor]|uniref:Uncharacterized protein n=1 Tax=Circinella minor TaxID=1195481 RepID=A0A8H7SAH5_9FUNG|nr:hypothetical protein INT45_001056 [Circinella minor]